jgi:hypothetical protein
VTSGTAEIVDSPYVRLERVAMEDLGGMRAYSAPASFPDELLLVAGHADRDRCPGLAVDSALMARDTLFIVLAPHRPCPDDDPTVLSTGLMSYSLHVGRMAAYDSPIVFAEPKKCPAPRSLS